MERPQLQGPRPGRLRTACTCRIRATKVWVPGPSMGSAGTSPSDPSMVPLPRPAWSPSEPPRPVRGKDPIVRRRGRPEGRPAAPRNGPGRQNLSAGPLSTAMPRSRFNSTSSSRSSVGISLSGYPSHSSPSRTDRINTALRPDSRCDPLGTFSSVMRLGGGSTAPVGHLQDVSTPLCPQASALLWVLLKPFSEPFQALPVHLGLRFGLPAPSRISHECFGSRHAGCPARSSPASEPRGRRRCYVSPLSARKGGEPHLPNDEPRSGASSALITSRCSTSLAGPRMPFGSEGVRPPPGNCRVYLAGLQYSAIAVPLNPCTAARFPRSSQMRRILGSSRRPCASAESSLCSPAFRPAPPGLAVALRSFRGPLPPGTARGMERCCPVRHRPCLATAPGRQGS